MEYIFIVIATSIANISSFYFGTRIGQKVSKNEEIKLPSPIKTIQNYKESREIQKQMDIDRIINENIDNYNGTSLGQQDIPR